MPFCLTEHQKRSLHTWFDFLSFQMIFLPKSTDASLPEVWSFRPFEAVQNLLALMKFSCSTIAQQSNAPKQKRQAEQEAIF